jgi:hypothetical protein
MLKVLVIVSTKVKEALDEIVNLKAKVKASKMATIHAPSRTNMVKMTTAPPEEGLHKLMDLLESSDLSGRQESSRVVEPKKARRGGERHVKLATTSDVIVLKTRTEDKSVKFTGLGCRPLGNCQVWIKKNFPSNRYGLIMDPLLMLNRVFRYKDENLVSQFKTLESRVTLKIATGGETVAIKALYFKRLQLFHSGQFSMSRNRNKS